MPVKKPDGVLQTTTSTGTGDLTLDGSVASYRTFAQAVTAGEMAWGDEVYYVVQDGTNREWGVAQVISSGPTLKRSTGTITGSTNGGLAISAAGGGVTQIFPGVPDGKKLLTQDRKANGGTIAETGTDNAFSVAQTFADDVQIDGGLTVDTGFDLTGNMTVLNGDVVMTNTDAGASAGPAIKLYRNSASPAANDYIGDLQFLGKDSGGNETLYSEIVARILDATNGSEDARLVLRSVVAGALTDLLLVGSDGIAAAGLSAMGAGTGNFTALYVNGVEQVAQTRQAFRGSQSSGTGSAVSGANKIQLSQDYMSITSASFDNTNDEVTLPAGTYNFRASISSFEETSYGGTAEFRLRNTTDGSTIGSSVVLPTIGTNLAGGAVLHGDFTLAGSKVVRLEINYASGSHTWTARYPVLEIVKVG